MWATLIVMFVSNTHLYWDNYKLIAWFGSTHVWRISVLGWNMLCWSPLFEGVSVEAESETASLLNGTGRYQHIIFSSWHTACLLFMNRKLDFNYRKHYMSFFTTILIFQIICCVESEFLSMVRNLVQHVLK